MSHQMIVPLTYETDKPSDLKCKKNKDIFKTNYNHSNLQHTLLNHGFFKWWNTKNTAMPWKQSETLISWDL